MGATVSGPLEEGRLIPWNISRIDGVQPPGQIQREPEPGPHDLMFVTLSASHRFRRVVSARKAPGPGALLLSGIVLLSLLNPGNCQAQTVAVIRGEENLRAEPRGLVLGRVLEGMRFPVLATQDQWVQIQLEGWIWTRSLQATHRLGFDLRVSADPQENLREGPSGAVLGRLVQGTLLNRVEDVPGWTRVRRGVWIWRESVDLSGPENPSPPAAGRPASPVVAPSASWWRSGPRSTPLLSAPDGDTLGLAEAGIDLQLLAREGNWVRVRIEGWAWAPEGETPDSLEDPVLVEVSRTQVVEEPDRFRGRTVTWDLQFVSLERAEPIRTDFYEGEPFLLTRTPEGEGGFVYVAVPPERVTEFDALIPLEQIRVVGRVRVGAAVLTGNPILELLEFSRIPR